MDSSRVEEDASMMAKHTFKLILRAPDGAEFEIGEAAGDTAAEVKESLQALMVAVGAEMFAIEIPEEDK